MVCKIDFNNWIAKIAFLRASMLLPTILNFSDRGPTDTTYFNVSTLSTRRDNNIEINQLENGDCYKYLGQDEDIEI